MLLEVLFVTYLLFEGKMLMTLKPSSLLKLQTILLTLKLMRLVSTSCSR